MRKHYCNRCGTQVLPEIEKSIDYPYWCPNHDENLYSFEVHTKPLIREWFETTINRIANWKNYFWYAMWKLQGRKMN